MCRPLCVLALVAIFLGAAQSWSGSWDFATASRGQLDFYTGGRKTYSENLKIRNIDKIVYDVVSGRLFFHQYDNYNILIFSCDIAIMKIEPVVHRSAKKVLVEGLAYDPAEELLFWTNAYNGSIHSMSLKPRSSGDDNKYGNLIISTRGRTPYRIAVDSCKGYIYWTSTDEYLNKFPSTIERARFDGSKKETVIGKGLQVPHFLVVDQQTQKLYWADGTQPDNHRPDEEKHFRIESADLNGQNRTILYNETGMDQPMAFAVSKDSIYWLLTVRIVKQIPKKPLMHVKPLVTHVLAWDEIFTNYEIYDQIKGIPDCNALQSLIMYTNDTVIDDFCFHGSKVVGESQCKCELGYTGKRCDVAVCKNYCFQGNCSASPEGKPTCRCHSGYSGERCEVNKCQGYCLHNGTCSLNEEKEPVCKCEKDYEGARCEATDFLDKCFKKVVTMAWDTIKADVASVISGTGVKPACPKV